MEKIAKEHIHDLSEELAKELIALGSAELTLTDVGPPTQEMFFHCALSPCLFLSYSSNASPYLTLLLFLPPPPSPLFLPLQKLPTSTTGNSPRLADSCFSPAKHSGNPARQISLAGAAHQVQTGV